MSNIAGVALITASLFLLVVAVLLNSPHLFYMSTAMVVTIFAARLQAWLAVRGLRFSRSAPSSTVVGEWVTIEVAAESDDRFRRPLMSVYDHLPPRLVNDSISPSTPLAPAFAQPVITRYKLRPDKRGVYRWSKLSVIGHDALGIVSLVKEYAANAVELVVFPAPIPVSFDLNSASGWGAQETDHGLSRGTGIEPRGIREYVSGDSIRYVHWRSTARTGQLVVKEFETGANSTIAFILQRTIGSDVGEGARSSLELMCGHLAHICGRAVRQGMLVQFPNVEEGVGSVSPYDREQEVLRILAEAQADSKESFADTIASARKNLLPGATVHVLASVADPTLLDAVRDLRKSGHSVVAMVYDASAFFTDSSRLKFLGASRTSLSNSRTVVPSAADPAYMDELRGAGAMVREMPLDGLGK